MVQVFLMFAKKQASTNDYGLAIRETLGSNIYMTLCTVTRTKSKFAIRVQRRRDLRTSLGFKLNLFA